MNEEAPFLMLFKLANFNALGALFATSCFGVIWMSGAVGIGMRVDGALIVDIRMRSRIPNVYFSMLSLAMFSNTIWIFTPSLLVPFLVPVYLLWNYVAGREILGGISENGAQQVTAAKVVFA